MFCFDKAEQRTGKTKSEYGNHLHHFTLHTTFRAGGGKRRIRKKKPNLTDHMIVEKIVPLLLLINDQW
jgi:hypothetical protein